MQNALLASDAGICMSQSDFVKDSEQLYCTAGTPLMNSIRPGPKRGAELQMLRSCTFQHKTACCRRLHALHTTTCPAQQGPSRGGVPAIEVAVCVSQDDQVSPGSDGCGVHLPTAQQAPLGALGLSVADLQQRPRSARCQPSPAASIGSPETAHTADILECSDGTQQCACQQPAAVSLSLARPLLTLLEWGPSAQLLLRGLKL